MKNSVGAMMRCKVCNQYKPDRCICKKEKKTTTIGIVGTGRNTLVAAMLRQLAKG